VQQSYEGKSALDSASDTVKNIFFAEREEKQVTRRYVILDIRLLVAIVPEFEYSLGIVSMDSERGIDNNNGCCKTFQR